MKPLNNSMTAKPSARIFIGNFLPVIIFSTLAKVDCNQCTSPLFSIRTPTQPMKLISQCIAPSLGIIWFHRKASDQITSKATLYSC